MSFFESSPRLSPSPRCLSPLSALLRQIARRVIHTFHSIHNLRALPAPSKNALSFRHFVYIFCLPAML